MITSRFKKFYEFSAQTASPDGYREGYRLFCLLLLIGSLSSCSPKPYAATNKIYEKKAKDFAQEYRQLPELSVNDSLQIDRWVGTTNFNVRKPNYVIIHHTAQDSTERTLHTFTLPRTSVSSHYVIGRDGEIVQMLHDHFRAWHAGSGKWGNTTDLNSASIGIELDNDGFSYFPEAQINSLLKLLAVLKEKHNIPTANFIGHADIAPTRKVDPSPHFPWKTLADQGFGLWHNLDPNPAATQEPLPDFDVRNALRIIGYDTSDLPAAIRAFKIHFVQWNVDPELSERDLRKLYSIYQQSL
jgi:N-acetylmuramoyl-L-alanine amidase